MALAISSPTFLGDYSDKTHKLAVCADRLDAAYQTKRTNLRSQGRGSTDFSSSGPEVDDLNFGGVLILDI